MSCRSVLRKIGPYVDGELSSATREDIEAHFVACPNCARHADELRRLDELAGRQKAPPVSGEEWSRLWSNVLRMAQRKDVRIDEQTRTTVLRSRGWGQIIDLRRLAWVLVPVAALVVLGLLLPPWMIPSRQGTLEPNTVSRTQSESKEAKGATSVSVPLEGSESFAEKPSPSEPEIKESGEAESSTKKAQDLGTDILEGMDDDMDEEAGSEIEK
jgi:anti-sigma factor RsiW